MLAKDNSNDKITGHSQPSKDEENAVIIVDASQFAFWKAHEELRNAPRQTYYPPSYRKLFWQVVIPGEYHGDGAQRLLDIYLRKLENELGQTLKRRSLFYWLHVYRRLAPESIGDREDSSTVLSTRAILEAAIQKFGAMKEYPELQRACETEPGRILNGIINDESVPEPLKADLKKWAHKSREFVLLNFTRHELSEIYHLEGLAYEIWRTVAMRRIVGKGAWMAVDSDSDVIVWDTRSDELDQLVKIFDQRAARQNMSVSATGTIFGEEDIQEVCGLVALPRYNVSRRDAKFYEEAMKMFDIEFNEDMLFNFEWCSFDLGSFMKSHRFFAPAFEQKYDLELADVIAVIAAMLHRVLSLWKKNPGQILRDWQRSYELVTRAFLTRQIESFLERYGARLGFPISLDGVNVEKVLDFLSLTERNRSDIDLVTHGPHKLLLPIGECEFILDYAWIFDFLYNLFYEVSVSDQNFKGYMLEAVVHKDDAPLTNKPCKATDGTSKQIDASFKVGDSLLIAECRAKGKSFGFFRGDTRAIKYRNDFIQRLLWDIDEKGRWLASRPVGLNYDIHGFTKVICIGVTPFVEYIPGLSESYWLVKGVPRILTPVELRQMLADGTADEACCYTGNAHHLNAH